MSKKPCDMLITAQCVITQNAARDVLWNAALAVTRGKITDVGNADRLKNKYEPGELLDLNDCMILPGLINNHTHASMTLLRGLADDLPLMVWLNEHIWPKEKMFTPEIIHVGAMLACAEMIRTGTTCFADMYLVEDETARAADISGIRAVVGEGIFVFPSPAYDNLDKCWELLQALYDKYRDHPRIKTAIMPHAIYTTNAEILEKSFETAEKHDCPWKIHLAENQGETQAGLEQFGKRPVEYLKNLGVLSARTLIAHGVDLTDEEIEILARTKTKAAHCPKSNMKLASGAARVTDMVNAGMTVGLGTDGAASNNMLNMFSEMTAAALLQKVVRLDPTVADAGLVLDMATVNGAACQMWPEIGSLEPGKAADLVALDLNSPNMQPLYHPVSQAVYAANGAEVRLTMVAGEVLYKDGKFEKFDYPALLDEVGKIRDWLKENAA